MGRDRKAVEWFDAVFRWLDRRRIPGTFVWGPKTGNRRGDHDELWTNTIGRARRVGHDFRLYGLTHDCLEPGVPQEGIRRHAPKLFERYEREMEK